MTEALTQLLDRCIDAFEEDGGCGHDLGYSGVLSILCAYEQCRTQALVAELLKGDLGGYIDH